MPRTRRAARYGRPSSIHYLLRFIMPEHADARQRELLSDFTFKNADEEALRRLVVDLAAIDRETKRYHDGLAGKRPWTKFKAPKFTVPFSPQIRRITSTARRAHSELGVSEHGDTSENPAREDGSLRRRGPVLP